MQVDNLFYNTIDYTIPRFIFRKTKYNLNKYQNPFTI
jgi:hypothetical protein